LTRWIVGLAPRRESALRITHLVEGVAEGVLQHDLRVRREPLALHSRPGEIEPPSQGRIVAEPQVGGLYHRSRRAA
jgi:hypothetical protein